VTEQGTSDALANTNASARGAAERAMAARAAAAEAEARLAEHLSAAASCTGRLRLRDFVGSSAAPIAPSSRSHTHTNTHSTANTNTKADSDPYGRQNESGTLLMEEEEVRGSNGCVLRAPQRTNASLTVSCKQLSTHALGTRTLLEQRVCARRTNKPRAKRAAP